MELPVIAAPRARILVVDDSPDNLYLMQALLEDQYEVTTAATGEEALEAVRSDAPPDLILLDIVMPRMGGFEVMRRLRGDPVLAAIPVIFLTALGNRGHEQEGLELGAVDFVTKPVCAPVALARIRSHLERSGNERRLQALTNQLGRYMAPQVTRSLSDGSRHAEIRTQHKMLTVFFSDIKDFTALTARWQPEDITFLLNSYFSEMSRIAQQYGGTLDKFIGDAMLIFFGDPDTLGPREDALQCLRMAQAMQRRMRELQLLWCQLGADKGFQIRIGISSGYCNVGNFGSDLRMDYTIIGPEVNLAARLQEAAAPGGIVISRETQSLVQGEVDLDATGPLLLKGFADPVQAYAVRDESSVPVSGPVQRDDFHWHIGPRLLLPLVPAPEAAPLAAKAERVAAGERRVALENARAEHLH